MDDLRLVEAEAVEVDHVEVGAVAGREHAAVRQSDGAGGVAAVALHEERERDPIVVPVAAPVLQQRCGEAPVADRADVGAAVAEARHGVRVDEHLVAAVEIAVDVVEERQVDEAFALVGEHHVEREFLGRHARPGGAGTDRIGELRFVVGLVEHLEQQVEAADERTAKLVARPLVGRLQHPRPHVGIAQQRHPFGERAVGDLPVGGDGHERVERALQSQDQAHRTWRDLAGHREPVGVGRGDAIEDAAERVGQHRIAGDRDRQRSARTLDHPAQRRELRVDVEEVRHHLQHPGPGRADPFGDSDQLVGCCGQRRGVRPGRGPVVPGAAGGEAEGAGLDPLPGELGHQRDVVSGGVLVVGAALAHHV